MELTQSQRGIGLLELMLSLAIIAILLVMATRYFASARQGQEVASAISLIQAVSAASQSFFVANGNAFTGLSASALKTQNYLPANTNLINPWGGTVTVTGGSDTSNPTAVNITLTNVPGAACTQLAGALKSQAITLSSCVAVGSSGTFSVEI